MSETIEGYIDSLKRKSSKTKEIRRYALKRLENWADKRIEDLEEADVEDFIEDLQAEGLKNSTINNYLSAVRQYFKYLRKNLPIGVNEQELRETLIKQKRYDQIIDVKNLQELGKQKEAIPKSTIEDLLKRAKEHNTRHYRIIVLLAYFGVRKGELLNLQHDHVDRDDRKIRIVESKTLAGRREIPYAEAIGPFLEGNDDSEYVVGKDYSVSTFNYLLNTYQNESTGNLYPHRFRETVDTYLIEAGVDKYIINQLMGWKGQGDMADYYRGKTKRLEFEKRTAMEDKHYLLPILKDVEKGEKEKDEEKEKNRSRRGGV